MVSGMSTYFWLEPTRIGTFDILCADLCGNGHGALRGMVMMTQKMITKLGYLTKKHSRN